MHDKKKLYEDQCVRCTKKVEVICNDQAGRSFHVLCNIKDTVKDLKKVIEDQTGIRWDTMLFKRSGVIFRDYMALKEYGIYDGMNIDLYHQ